MGSERSDCAVGVDGKVGETTGSGAEGVSVTVRAGLASAVGSSVGGRSVGTSLGASLGDGNTSGEGAGRSARAQARIEAKSIEPASSSLTVGRPIRRSALWQGIFRLKTDTSARNLVLLIAARARLQALIAAGHRSVVFLAESPRDPAVHSKRQRTVSRDPFSVVAAGQMQMRTVRDSAFAGWMTDRIARAQAGAGRHPATRVDVHIHHDPARLLESIAIEVLQDFAVF